MAIQAVGMNMTFYIVQRTTEELYTMFELEHIRCPSLTDEMTMMFGLMDKVMDIVQIFRTYCVTSPEQTSVVEVSKETLKYPILWAMTTATKLFPGYSSKKKTVYCRDRYHSMVQLNLICLHF
ncbi:hypothetical protein RMCBS344292_04190 [Rhizopus microsporus]|nr:hypothetical protein RMCBS344292_04190 [Rhizopus microsporus]